MGNPGIKEPLNYCNLNMFNNSSNIDAMLMPTTVITDYREYILQMLPYLQYLDGVPRESLLKILQCSNNVNMLPLTPPSSSVSPTNSIGNGSSSQGQQYNDHSHRKISPSLSFKDLFRLKRRKKSYPSSSTN